MTKERMLILDSNSLMNRAFYALPPLTNSDGLHTNAVFGFTTMLIKMKEEIKPDYIVATFDRKAPTFRHNEYKDYKAGRKQMPPELAEQFPVVKDLLSKLAVNIFEIDGFEADDLIGTLSVFAEKQGIEIFIVTGDRDALQLATDNVKVVITKKGMTEKEIYDEKRMIEEFGVTPKEFIDVKGLMGDASDNIPGVPGIGEKTAFKLIKEYKSVENVLSNIDKISGKKLKENLTQFSEQAIFSKKLATIMTEVPVDIDLDDIRSKESFDFEGVRQLFYRLQFKSLIDKFDDGGESQNHTPEESFDLEFQQVQTIESLKNVMEALDEMKEQHVSATFTLLDANVYSKAAIEKIFIAAECGNYCIKVNELLQENRDETVEFLRHVFENESVKKTSFDVKMPHAILHKLGVDMKGVDFDAKIAAYLIDATKGNYELSDLIGEYMRTNVSGTDDDNLMKQTYLLEELHGILDSKIRELHMEKLLFDVEQPLEEVLASMESEGFKVDKNMLDALGEKFKAEIETTQKEIYSLAEEEFNINSPKQLGKILFEKLDLPVIKKTKTGYSTNAEVLEELKDKHPVIEMITYFRQLSKLYSTYIEGLKSVIDADGRIHSSFNQTVTTTGRLSSTEPNLQNIPVKYEMGREIRKVFVPNDEDCVILSADYSQIELRVLAHIADDENLIDAFMNHSDIHTKTASEVFKVPMDEVTKTMRSNAKAVNFGIVYGIGDFSLAKDLGITRKEAKSYIDAYFERYPQVKKYMEDIVEEAKRNMSVTTILNRRRFIPEIQASNKIVQSLGQRLAMNTPIQGSAADIIKLAMVNVYRKLNEKALKSTLILQVHDELILNVYKDELEEVEELVKQEMENVLDLKVKLEVDVNVGNNWYEAK